MRHLEAEALARLMDEPGSPEETLHLDGCALCAAEVEELRAQRRMLAGLPPVRPSGEDWTALEARLARAGLIVDAPDRPPWRAARYGGGGWRRAAAALVLLVGGGILGAALERRPSRDSLVGLSDGSLVILTGDAVAADWQGVSLEGAEELVRLTEGWHAAALRLYGERIAGEGRAPSGADPVDRLLTLEGLVTATEAAVRESPSDPFLNGLLVSTVAERRAALDRLPYALDQLR